LTWQQVDIGTSISLVSKRTRKIADCYSFPEGFRVAYVVILRNEVMQNLSLEKKWLYNHTLKYIRISYQDKG
jgi:hypothetical protein